MQCRSELVGRQDVWRYIVSVYKHIIPGASLAASLNTKIPRAVRPAVPKGIKS
jgi:hypothetical protein